MRAEAHHHDVPAGIHSKQASREDGRAPSMLHRWLAMCWRTSAVRQAPSTHLSYPTHIARPPPTLTSISRGGGSKSSGRSAPWVRCMMSRMWSRTEGGSRKPGSGGPGGSGGPSGDAKPGGGPSLPTGGREGGRCSVAAQASAQRDCCHGGSRRLLVGACPHAPRGAPTCCSAAPLLPAAPPGSAGSACPQLHPVINERAGRSSLAC